MPLVRLPIETPTSTLKSGPSDATPTLISGKDPFLYNPRKTVAGRVCNMKSERSSCQLITSQGKSLVVQNEVVEFVVMLQNPYIFDLELQSLYLRYSLYYMSSGCRLIGCSSTSGVPFDCHPIHVLIPATSIHQVILSGRPLQPGVLYIRGCYAQAPGGNRREFILPISTDKEEAEFSRKKSMLACEIGRSKYSGIECFPWERKKRHTRTPLVLATTVQKSFRFLECKVVPEQPLLRIRRTSVTHGAVMLYDGETYGLGCYMRRSANQSLGLPFALRSRTSLICPSTS